MTIESNDHPTDTPRQEGGPELRAEPRSRRERQPWHKRFGLGAAGFEATKRAFFLGILTLVLLIPLGMIGDLVQERESRRLDVDAEITGQWGGQQTVLGPILAVPYRFVVDASDSANPRTATSQLFFLPKHLAVDATLKTERRAKSIYEILVYGGAVSLTGDFTGLDDPRKDIAPEMIDWSGARLILGVADIAGLRTISAGIGGRPPFGEDAAQRNPMLANSVAVPAPLDAVDRAKAVPFTVSLDLRGNGEFRVVPIGDTSTVTLAADWPHPDFSGRTLPDAREISDLGFTASWSLGALARDLPASWRTGELNVETLWNGGIGVGFVEPGDVHQQTDRILKYGVLVIALTFATIFVNGLLGGRRVHPVQYLLVGAALCLFYMLLLSLSEHIPFGQSYAIASVADIALIAWYAWRTIGRKLGYATAGVLGAVQAYIYDLLQMDDYALLAGTLALFAALLAVMIATRNIDWYRVGGAERTA